MSIPPRLFFPALTALAAFIPFASNGATIFKDKIVPHWIEEDSKEGPHRFCYQLHLPDGKSQFVTVDAETGKKETSIHPNGNTPGSLPALEAPHPSLASENETAVDFENRLDTAVDLFWIDTGGNQNSYGKIPAHGRRAQHTFSGHVWLVKAEGSRQATVFEAADFPATALIEKGVMRNEPLSENREQVRSNRSPDGKWEAIVRDHNLFVRETASGEEFQLSTNGGAHDSYARDGEIERGIGMDFDKTDPLAPVPEVYWSPDSKHLVAMRSTPGTRRKIHLVESSPRNQVQPKLISVPYLKPGDEVPVRKPHLFELASRKEIPVDHALFANPWSIDEVRWSPDSSRFTFEFNQRGHQVLRVLAVNAGTGAVRPLVEETSKTFIDYSGKYFCRYLDATAEILWMSERDGWNHLYLYNANTGTLKNQVTRGNWVVRRVDFVDEKKRQIWFLAGGVIPGQDPYFLHYCRVNFDGSGFTLLTEGNGTHSVQFSPGRKYLVDTWSRVDLPPVTELRRCSDGKQVCQLETAIVTGSFPAPKPFVAKGRDGSTDIYGVLWFPSDFDPKKKFPVVEDIYAGPQDSFTPKQFSLNFRQQKLADRGFIVVQMDGMGTSNRSKPFHDICWKNLRDAGFPDRILWIQAAAKEVPAMDLGRVGIYGTSAGGQDALRAVLDHGDFYKAAVADSGCYDNRMDKIWWNEQWMGWPVDESYARSSCVVDAPKLQGHLLLMAGELDKNVDPASTMQVVNALVKADKPFDLLIAPGVGHGVLSTEYGWKRLVDFFERTLR
jgi:dipeptidyl aminopeptidase/acylaminoacyl peptidase